MAGYAPVSAPVLDGRSQEAAVVDGGGDAAPADDAKGDAARVDASIADATRVDVSIVDAAGLDGPVADAAAVDASITDVAGLDGPVADAAAVDGSLADIGIDSVDLPAICTGLTMGPMFSGGYVQDYNRLTSETVARVDVVFTYEVPTGWSPTQTVNCVLADDAVTEISASNGSVSPSLPDWGFFVSSAWPTLQTAIERDIGPLPLDKVWYHGWGPADLELVAVLFYGTGNNVAYIRGDQLRE